MRSTYGEIDRGYIEEALVRWRAGDLLMMLFYLDKAGFHGIEECLAARVSR